MAGADGSSDYNKNNTEKLDIYEIYNASVTKVTLGGLKYYSSYTLTVKACREGHGDNCSTEVMVHQRTAPIGKIYYYY